MTDRPPVSVVVPVYNCTAYLPRCIDSILRQTLPGIEIVLVNDGSTDECLKICQSYAEAHENIIVLSQINSGAAKARAEGVRTSSGEYICFIDSDDWIDVNMLKVLYEQVVKTKSDIIQCGFVKTDHYEILKNQVPLITDVQILPARTAIMQMFGCLVGGIFCFTLWGKLFRRKLFSGMAIPERPCMINDVQLVARAFGEAETVSHISERLYY